MRVISFQSRTIKADPGRNSSEAKFFDIMIDGESLLDQLEPGGSARACSLGFARDINLNKATIEELLKNNPSELSAAAEGRTMLFVCSECGDIGCGAITAEIEKKENSYIWKNFAHENNSSPILSSDYINFADIEFEKSSYESAFEELKKIIGSSKSKRKWWDPATW